MIRRIILFVLLFVSVTIEAQYAPSAGMPGSTAIYKDSAVFIGWANEAIIYRGWENAQDTSLGFASYGDKNNALGFPDNSTVSLGDGGLAVLTFAHPIVDGPSWDFAVFENSFDGNFLELAFVEVSTDGQHYVRFPAHSLTQVDSQITSFGILNASKINNLAGKYMGGFGTPFDLSELDASPFLDIQNINFIRLIDVVGSIDSNFASYDTANNPINDPFPTPFPSSGFDLDAVGVIHHSVGIYEETLSQIEISVFPNPCSSKLTIRTNHNANIEIYSMSEQLLMRQEIQIGLNIISISKFPKGIYILNISSNGLSKNFKLIVNY